MVEANGRCSVDFNSHDIIVSPKRMEKGTLCFVADTYQKLKAVVEKNDMGKSCKYNGINPDTQNMIDSKGKEHVLWFPIKPLEHWNEGWNPYGIASRLWVGEYVKRKSPSCQGKLFIKAVEPTLPYPVCVNDIWYSLLEMFNTFYWANGEQFGNRFLWNPFCGKSEQRLIGETFFVDGVRYRCEELPSSDCDGCALHGIHHCNKCDKGLETLFGYCMKSDRQDNKSVRFAKVE